MVRAALLSVSIMGALATGCAAGVGPCDVGSELCTCTAGGACDPGLVCVADRCVASGDAAIPDAGSRDAGSHDAGTGDGGPIDTDDCSPNPCQHGGMCRDEVEGHSCTCPLGYVGDDCEFLDCEPGRTECGGECVDLLADPRYCSTSATCGAGCAAGQTCSAGSCVAAMPTVFAFTGAMQSFVVPAGVTSIAVTADGASGGDGWNIDVDTPLGTGGRGGRVTATLAVTPGETLYVFVGGAGGDATASAPGAAGWNGGGAGGPSPYGYSGGGGGGASDIRRGGTALTDRVVVAGGGGSGSGWCTSGEGNGGAGGDLTGGSGQSCVGIAVGTGGSQSAGGSVGGSLGVGGTYSGSTQAASAGGGGYYGGGASHGSGGGGGSSYVTPTATGVTHTPGVVDGDGTITITP